MTKRKNPAPMADRSSYNRLIEIFEKMNKGEATELICQPCDGTGKIGGQECKFCFGIGVSEIRLLYDDDKSR